MLYVRYLEETLSQKYLEDPEGKGFLTYSYDSVPGLDFPHVYIVDLYTAPEHRKSRIAARLANKVAEEAKGTGRNFMFGSVCKHSKTKDASALVLNAYGMTRYSEDDDVIYFIKELI